MKAVNLLPKTSGLAGLAQDRPQLLIAIAIGAVAITGMWAFAAGQSADSAQSQLDQANVQKASLDQQVAALSVYSQRASTLATAQTTVNLLAASRTDWERLIRDVVTVLPAGVSVSNITASLPTTNSSSSTAGQANTSVPQGMHIVGNAYTQTQVATAMALIATVPGLGTPRLATSQVTDTTGKGVVTFTIDVPVNTQALDVAAVAAGTGSAATTAASTASTGSTP
jgi:hypothetical protein